MKRLTLLTGLILAFHVIFAQDKDVLIKIDDHKITAEEFMRVYQKNNNEKTMDSKSIDEYLDLYIDFKLKVLEAQALGYDTLDSFKEELSGYREKLAKPYLESEEVQEELLKEAYDRMVEEVEVSHILFRVPKDASLDDTLEVYNQALDVSKKIQNGELSFEEAVNQYSADESTGGNNGYIGYISAFTTVYPFETAAYNTEEGGVSKPVRTRFGYHVVKVHDKRKSPGEIRAAHIFKRVNRGAPSSEWDKAKEQIDSIYRELESGVSFDLLAKEHSDDSHTANRGGDVGWFKAGKMVPEFAEAAIAINEKGDYTEPVRTDFGYHIIKLLDTRPVAPFEELKEDLTKQVKNDPRNQLSKEKVVQKLKKENEFKEYPKNLDQFLSASQGKVFDRKFDSIQLGNNETLFTIGEKKYTQEQFLEFLKNYRSRNRNNEMVYVTDAYKKYVEQELLAYEENRLDEKYPEFRHLVKEYHDGILLFNLMNDKVWNQAAEDTAGLELFYEQNKDQYVWDQRADVSEYKYEDASITDKLKNAAVKRANGNLSKEALLAEFCDTTKSVPCISITDKKVERGRDDVVDALTWEAGTVSDVRQNSDVHSFSVINGVVDPTHKKLSEARGMVISDYQNYLEDKWLYDLHEKYDIQINSRVLKKVKKGKYN